MSMNYGILLTMINPFDNRNEREGSNDHFKRQVSLDVVISFLSGIFIYKDKLTSLLGTTRELECMRSKYLVSEKEAMIYLSRMDPR